MKKFSIICAGLALAFASQAQAQVVDTNAADGADGLAIWFDTRNSVASILTPAAPFTDGTSREMLKGKILIVNNVEAGNAGGPGDGQTLWVSPRLPANPAFPGFGLHWTGKKASALVNHSIKTISKYATVESRGATGEIIAALGLTTDIVKGGTPGTGNQIQDVSVSSVDTYWSAPANNVVNDLGDNWEIVSKAVRVPVSDNAGTPVYNAAGGLIPSTTPYKLADLTITADVWQASIAISNSTYSVRDKVNNLLVTRVVESGGPLSPEDPDFGYTTDTISGTPGVAGAVLRTGSPLNGNLPEANSGGDGLTVGTTSVQADATIIVQTKGDFTNDGIVTVSDNPLYNAVVTGAIGLPIRQREIYLGDFTNEGAVTVADNPGYNGYVAQMGIPGNNCSVPANCP